MAHYHDAQIMKYGIGLRNEIHLAPGLKNWLIYQLIISRAGIDIVPVTIDEVLNDNDLLPLLGGTRIIHTPGHSMGHISLLTEGTETLIAGDLFSNRISLGLSVFYEDIEIGLSSIRKVTDRDFDKVLFGHGRPILKNASSLIRQAFGDHRYSLIQSF